MQMLKEINDTVNQFNQYVKELRQELEETKDHPQNRLGLIEAFGTEEDIPYERQDTSKFGKPQTIQSGSGKETMGGGRPQTPVRNDLYFDPSTQQLRVISNRNREFISGKDFQTTVQKLIPADQKIIRDIVAKMEAMGQGDMAKEITKRIIWVPRDAVAQEQPRKAVQPPGEQKMVRKVPPAPDWKLQ